MKDRPLRPGTWHALRKATDQAKQDQKMRGGCKKPPAPTNLSPRERGGSWAVKSTSMEAGHQPGRKKKEVAAHSGFLQRRFILFYFLQVVIVRGQT
jgi:hypothetical protein